MSHLQALAGLPAFRTLFLAQALSLLGDWFSNLALLLLTFQLTGNPAAAALVLAAKSAPRLLMLPLGGLAADRLERRRLMIAMDLLRIPLALAPLLVSEASALWLLWASVFLMALCASFFNPCRTPVVAALLHDRRELLPEANSQLALSNQLALFIGPALGVLVISLWGLSACFVLNALSFALSALLLLYLRLPRQVLSPGAAPLTRGALLAGARAVLRIPALRGVVSGLAAGATLVFLAQAELPALAGKLGAPEWTGYLLSAVGVGAFIGSRLAARHTRLRPLATQLLLLSNLAAMVLAFILALPLPTLLLFAINGAGTMWAELIATRQIQELPAQIQGRSSAFLLFTLTLGQLLGALLGLVLSALSPDLALTLVGGALVVFVVLAGWPRTRAAHLSVNAAPSDS